MTTIRIPAPLRPYTNGQSSVQVNGDSVSTVLRDLTSRHPDLRPHLFEDGKLRSFVNVFLNEEDVRYLDGVETAVSESDTLMIIPSIAGGKAG